MTRAKDMFERYHLDVFRYLRKMTWDQAAAEDLLQEVFLRIVRAEDRFRPQETDKAWVFTITRNVLSNHRRSNRRKGETVPVQETAFSTGTLERLNLKEALDRLDPVGRDIFLLREAGGLGYQEIAGVCDLTADAVRNRIYRARKELRTFLAMRQS
jgi:RNA polymerase sigma-70 factor (ECF subfamily)